MSIATAILSGAKALLGSGRNDGADKVMEVARGVGGWIDEQQFTEEEKAKSLADVATRVTEFVSATAAENSERSITRRSIAIWLMRAEVITLTSSGVIYPIDPEWSEYLFKLAAYDSPLGWMALGVGVFFFGSHMLRIYK